MREEKFESWEAFRSLVRGERFAVPVYWRGQGERRWPLSSSMERVILRHIEDMAPVESARKDVIAVLARQGLVAICAKLT